MSCLWRNKLQDATASSFIRLEIPSEPKEVPDREAVHAPGFPDTGPFRDRACPAEVRIFPTGTIYHQMEVTIWANKAAGNPLFQDFLPQLCVYSQRPNAINRPCQRACCRAEPAGFCAKHCVDLPATTSSGTGHCLVSFQAAAWSFSHQKASQVPGSVFIHVKGRNWPQTGLCHLEAKELAYYQHDI